MEGILERYQRYSFDERAVLEPNTEDQVKKHPWLLENYLRLFI